MITIGYVVLEHDSKQPVRTGSNYTGKTSKLYRTVGTARAVANRMNKNPKRNLNHNYGVYAITEECLHHVPEKKKEEKIELSVEQIREMYNVLDKYKSGGQVKDVLYKLIDIVEE